MQRLKKGMMIFLLAAFALSLAPVIGNTEFSADIPVLSLEDRYAEIEAEDCFLLDGYKVIDHQDASGGKHLLPSLPKTNDQPEARFEEKGGDDLQFYLDVKETAFYTIWIRGYWRAGNGSFWVSLNGNYFRKYFSEIEPNTHEWVASRSATLTPGRYYIGIQPRRNVEGIDKIIVCGDESYVPFEFGTKPEPFVLGPEGEKLRGLYYPLPAFTPPATRPRLMMTPEDIPVIKRNLIHPQNLYAYKTVLSIANSETKTSVENKEGDYSFSQTINNYLEACAFLYALDPKQNLKYGHKAVNGMVEYLSSVRFEGEDLALTRSGMIQYVAQVYDWCYDLLDDEKKEFFIKKALSFVAKIEVGWPPTKLSSFTSGHGGEGGLQVEMMSLAIATYEDYPDIWNVTAGRYFSKLLPMNNYYYNIASWHAEGDSYGKSRLAYEAKGNTILSKLGLGHLISKEEQYTHYAQIYRRRPDGNFMQDGDMWDITFKVPSYKGSHGPLLSVSSRYNDPYLKYELYKMQKNGVVIDGGDSRFSAVHFLILNDPALEPRSHEELPLTMKMVMTAYAAS